MEVSIQIPDDIAGRIGARGEDLSQRVLEAFIAQEFRVGHLNKPDLRRIFGFQTSYQIDGFLKAHGVFHEYTLEDLERERQSLRELGL